MLHCLINGRGYREADTEGKACICSKGKTSSISGRTQCVLEGRLVTGSLSSTRTMPSDMACFLVINYNHPGGYISVAS